MRVNLGIIAMGVAFITMPSVADNTPTSKSYVDGQIGGLQNTVPAIDNNTVLTTTNTSGEIGEKAIYDSSQSYAEQKDGLVTAEDANAAIINAINAELVCRDYDPETGGCLIYSIRSATPKAASKNLFDVNSAKVLYHNGTIQETQTGTGYTLTNSTSMANFILVEVGTINDLIGKNLTISVKTDCTGSYNANLCLCDNEGKNRIGESATLFVSQPDGPQTKVAMRLYLSTTNNEITCRYYDIQVEEGSTATAYEPYQNLYLPNDN